jgi:predicted DNA-binding transcriptional regulator AlpA
MAAPVDRRWSVTRETLVSPGTDERLLTAREVAGIIGVNIKRVYDLRIPAVRISDRSLRWSRRDVLNWIEERREVR